MKKKMLILIWVICICITTLSVTTSAEAVFDKKVFTQADINFYRSFIEDQTAYIAAIQLANGAIPTYSHGATGSGPVNPYFASFAALGLLENPDTYSNAGQYIEWHLSKINQTADVNGVAGTIYDYTIDYATGAATPSNDYDSTDSYAALFLEVLRKYVEKTGNISLLLTNRGTIEKIAEAMIATENNGLTWAKPSYHQKYTMDNAEVVTGLEAAAWLFENVFNDTVKTTQYANKAQLFKASIESILWNSDSQSYAKNRGSQFNTNSNLTTFYPDAACQLYPAMFGALDSQTRALDLYNTFCSNFPTWSQAAIPNANYPWAILSTAAAKIGDYARADSYLRAAKTKFIDTNNWKWYNAESGNAVVTAGILLRAATAGSSSVFVDHMQNLNEVTSCLGAWRGW